MSKLLSPFVLVEQNHRVIIERLGKFNRLVEPGLNFKVPLLDTVVYAHSLKEQVLEIDHQTAITRDNVKIAINGILYYKVVDAYKASYNVNQPLVAMSMLAQTTMRSEIGLLELDRTFEERDHLNTNILAALNEAGSNWGLQVLRYEIKDIQPPEQIKRCMELQAESERVKRSKILYSEGERQSKINVAEGYKQSKILEGEGKALQISQEARSVVETLQSIGKAIKAEDGSLSVVALKLRMAELYIKTLHQIFETSTIVVLPRHQGQSAFSPSAIATAFTLYKSLGPQQQQAPYTLSTPAVDNESISELKQKIKQLEKKNVSEKVKYLDDRALHNE